MKRHADAPGHGSQPVVARLEDIRFLGEFLYRASPHIRVREITFSSNDKPRADLVIVACLPATKETTLMLIDERRGSSLVLAPYSGNVRVPPPRIAPTVANVSADIEPGPSAFFFLHWSWSDRFGVVTLYPAHCHTRIVVTPWP